jgi:hypothetical protein
MRPTKMSREPIAIHEDEPLSDENETVMDESRDPLAESSGCMLSDSDEEVDDTVAEDMARFEESFKGITRRYRLINRIGEGWCVHHHLTRHLLTAMVNQARSRLSTRPKTSSTRSTRTIGTMASTETPDGRHLDIATTAFKAGNSD